MEKKQTGSCDELPGPSIKPAAAEPPQEGTAEFWTSKFKTMQQIRQNHPRCSSRKKRKRSEEAHEKTETASADEEPLLIHGLSVERYREIYNSVLEPSVLSALASCSKAEYVAQTLELKQRLWTALSRPQLQERVMEDGRVEVTEICDLT